MILELAARRDPKNVVIHYTLGNVWAVLMQYNKSINSFSNAVNILDDLEWVKKRKAAVEVKNQIISPIFSAVSCQENKSKFFTIQQPN